PCGKSGVAAPFGQTAINPQKCLLRHVFRATTIAAETICQIDQRPLPATHDAFESGGLSGQDSEDIGSIRLCIIVAGTHPIPLAHYGHRVRLCAAPDGCIFFLRRHSTNNQKSATEELSGLSHRLEERNSALGGCMNPMSVATASFFLLDSTLSADQKTVVATKGIEWLKWASVAPFIWLSVGSIAFF